jgi:hypothetical protein
MSENESTAEKIKRRLAKVENTEHVSKRIPVSSSMIKEVETTDDGKLVVVFNTGKVYKYNNIPDNIKKDMLKADSVGKYFSENVKNKYEHEKVAEIQRRLSDRTN